MKKIILFALSLVTLSFCAQAQTMETAEIDGVWYLLDKSNHTATVTYSRGEDTYAGRLIIPGYVWIWDDMEGAVQYPVSAIADSAFMNCPNLTGITIPNSVDTIGTFVTIGSDYITELKFEDGTTPIFMTEASFVGAIPFSCTYLYLGRNIADNGGVPVFHSFSGVMNVVIGENVTEIPLAFCPYARSLQSIQLNMSSVLTPGTRMFGFLDEDNPRPDASQITLYVPEGMLTAYQTDSFWSRFTIQEMDYFRQYGIQLVSGSYDFYQNGLYYKIWEDENNPDYKYLAVVIPQVWYLNPDGSYVSEWSSEFPYRQSSVIIPDSVTFYHWYDGRADRYSGVQESGVYQPLTYQVEAIGDYCFRNAKYLQEITIPTTVRRIGAEAFEYTDKLFSLTIPETVTEVGWLTFARSGLKEVLIPASSSNWGFGDGLASFQECSNLVKATFAPGTTRVQDRIFFGCDALRTIIIPDEVTEIGDGALAGCEALTELRLPASLQAMGDRMLRGCPIRELEVPAGVREVSPSCLLGTNIGKLTVNAANPMFDSRDNCNAIVRTADNTIVAATNGAFIPASVDSVGEEAFNELEGIRSLTLPANLKHVAYGGFMNLGNLTLITSQIQNPAGVLEEGAFESWWTDPRETATLYVPAGTLAAYRADAEWNLFQNIVEMAPENKPAEVTDIEPLAEEGTVTLADITAQTDLTNAVVDNLYLTCDTLNGDRYDAVEQAIVLSTVVDELMMENILSNPDNSDVIRNNFSGIIIELLAGEGVLSITVKTEGDHKLAVNIAGDVQEFEQLVKEVVEARYSLDAPARAYIYGFIADQPVVEAPCKHMLRRAKADWDVDEESAPSGSVAIYGISWNSNVADAIDQITNDHSPITNKVIIDGKLLILRDGKTFNAFGIEIKH